MIRVRRASERGHFDHGWLDTWHTFSFAGYYDPAHMGFRALRVINDDRVAPARGFGLHGHEDMEIITIVLEGALAHRDSLGHGAELRPGEVQHMSAGTGIRHSEFNPSASEVVHLYQIWIEPDRTGVAPRYAQTVYAAEGRRDAWQLIASPEGADGALPIQADARVARASVAEGAEVPYAMASGRHAWVQVLAGSVEVNGVVLATGDGAAISDEGTVGVLGVAPESDVLLFDLA